MKVRVRNRSFNTILSVPETTELDQPFSGEDADGETHWVSCPAFYDIQRVS